MTLFGYIRSRVDGRNRLRVERPNLDTRFARIRFTDQILFPQRGIPSEFLTVIGSQ